MAVATTVAITETVTGTIIRDRRLRVAGTVVPATVIIDPRVGGRAVVVRHLRVGKGAIISPRRVVGTVVGNPVTVRRPRRARTRRRATTSIGAPVIAMSVDGAVMTHRV